MGERPRKRGEWAAREKRERRAGLRKRAGPSISVGPAREKKSWARAELTAELGCHAGRGRFGPRCWAAGFGALCWILGFFSILFPLSFLFLNQTKFEFKYKFEFEPHSNN